MSDAEMVPVTQAARDAAAGLFGRWVGGRTGPDNMRAGGIDEHMFVQAFARAMLAAEAAAIERCIRVADECERQQDCDHGAANTGGAAAVAESLRSLKEGASHVG